MSGETINRMIETNPEDRDSENGDEPDRLLDDLEARSSETWPPVVLVSNEDIPKQERD